MKDGKIAWEDERSFKGLEVSGWDLTRLKLDAIASIGFRNRAFTEYYFPLFLGLLVFLYKGILLLFC